MFRDLEGMLKQVQHDKLFLLFSKVILFNQYQKFMLKVFIVILNYNGDNFVVNCLKSISQIKPKDYQLNIIVVDNASKDNSVFLIKIQLNIKNHLKNVSTMF